MENFEEDVSLGKAEEQKRALLAPHKLKKAGEAKEPMRRIITWVILGTLGFCITLSALRYFITGDGNMLLWLVSLVWSSIGGYYFGQLGHRPSNSDQGL